jgi:hypothetical protein
MTTDTETTGQDNVDECSYETFEWQIDARQLAATQEKIEKINKRAAKKGLGGRLDMTVTPVVRVEVDEDTGLKREWTEYRVKIGGVAPAYDGWQFIATLDWDEHAGLIVRSVPGAPQAKRDRLQEGWCDHCKTVRRRRVTYMMRNMDTDEQLQVGRSCIKDFIGWTGTISFLEGPNTTKDGDGWFGAGGGRADYSTMTVLTYAWAVIKTNGFVPASQAGCGATPTKVLVEMALYPNRKNSAEVEFARSLAPVAAEAEAKAQQVKDFVLSDDFNGPSDYVLNLKACIAAEHASPRNFGLVVSAPQAHARHQEQTLTRERQAKVGAESEWVGRVAAKGEKMDRRDIEVTVVGIRYIDGAYGAVTLYTLADPEGNLYKWFASDDKLGEDEGARFILKGSIKKHDEYQGTKHTHLTRCAVVRKLEAVTA